MSVWETYPPDYRAAEVRAVLAAVRSGECAALIGLSGAGKSNLMGFLAHRMNTAQPTFFLVDGNRAQPRAAAGLLRLTRQVLGDPSPSDDWAALETTVARRLTESPGGVCLLFDRFDALPAEERTAAAGPLRALRDTFKYQLTYVIAARRPLETTSELAELFYANTLWLGPLSRENAAWSVRQYAARRGVDWPDNTVDRLTEISWGYPSLLRACCEAYAAGAELSTGALQKHPAVQHRVQEFWADQPSAEYLRQSGLSSHPLLGPLQPPPTANNLDLTASEHKLLTYFQAHPGEVCSKDDLIRAVWPEDRVVGGLRDDSLAQLIRRLRQKIEDDPGSPHHIVTIPGRGYRYNR